jgi:hypothetical protein
MRTISSTGSAAQDMMLLGGRQRWPILSYHQGVRGPARRSRKRRRAGLAHWHTHNALYYDTKWKGQDTHEGATSCSTTQSLVLRRLLKFYQEDIVQRNNSRSYGIVLVCNCFSSPLLLAHQYDLIEMLARLG